jgi:hypothetical protein
MKPPKIHVRRKIDKFEWLLRILILLGFIVLIGRGLGWW